MRVRSYLNSLLIHMQPKLNPCRYPFVSLSFGMELDPSAVVAFVREPEGLPVINPEQIALELDLSVAFSSAWFTLTAHSNLAAVGLTAASS
jgi:hypothetical protein